MKQTARTAVALALAGLYRHQSYSNIVLDNLLKTGDLSEPDAALASRLFYGVIERRITLDYFITKCSSTPLRKMHPYVVQTLRIAVYQLLYMDKIPQSAAVNEAVRGVRQLGQAHAAGFVNGVLRGFLRQRESLLQTMPTGEDGLSVRYSCPTELIAFWRNAYGNSMIEPLLSCLNEAPDTYLRVNTLQTTDSAFAEELCNRGIEHRCFNDLPHCFQVKHPSLLNKLETIDKNCYYYQDKASQWACLALGAQPHERIADVCAAPGGKSLTVAQAMENQGELLSFDVYSQKCEEMKERAKRLGATIIEVAVRDASAPCPDTMRETFDRVICDVPCSGLGVIRRKPEIRYKTPAEFAELPQLQYAILESSAAMVKSGGVLQYSTCTLNPAENEEMTRRFLQDHAEFSPRILPLDTCFAALGKPPQHDITLFPHIHGTDGFYIAGFIKK